MGIERDLGNWQAAGLIDAATAESIRSYQSANHRPIALWAVVGLGLLALALGLVLVVAANWDLIPAALKLGVHLAVTAAATIAVWDGWRRQRPWQTEGALFLLAALLLAGIALQGQVYQLTAPMWQPLAWWALLMTPALLLLGATRLTAITLAMMLGWLALAFASEATGDLQSHAAGAALALPFLLVLLSLFRDPATPFRSGLRETALTALLTGASLAHFAWASEVSRADVGDALRAAPLPLAALAALLWWLHRMPRWPGRRVLATIIIASAAAVALAALVAHPNAMIWRLVGALLFAAMWGAIAKTASDAGWRLLFGVAIGAIAVRMLIVYFELFGSLAYTGIGLIIAGLLLIALALLWRRFMRTLSMRRSA